MKDKKRGFTAWLKRQHKRTGSIGDLSRDIRNDPNWPQNGSYRVFADYLMARGATEGEIVALYNSWCEWSKDRFGEIRVTI